MLPKGFLVSVGGEGYTRLLLEKRPHANGLQSGQSIFNYISRLINKPKTPVVELISVGAQPESLAIQQSAKAFSGAGCTIDQIHLRKRTDLLNPSTLKKIIDCDCAFFACEQKLRLASIFGGTEFLDILKSRYQNEPFVIAGSSSGAMAMSNAMMFNSGSDDTDDEDIQLQSGLGFIDDVIIDTHFHKSGGFDRLARAVALHPGVLGVGLGEGAGIVISNGSHLQAIGTGHVTVVDGQSIGYNNMADVSDDIPLAVENLTVHVLSSGKAFDCATRSFVENSLRYQ